MTQEIFGNGLVEETNEILSNQRVVLGNDSYFVAEGTQSVDGELYVGGKLRVIE